MVQTDVIRDGDLFLVTSKSEVTSNQHGLGLYSKDTRFLSRNEMMINGEKPVLLATHPKEDNLTSYRLIHEKADLGALEMLREPFIYEGCLYEKLTFKNYFPTTKTFHVTFRFEADFQDMFIVRGFRTGDVGKASKPVFQGDALTLNYLGKDDVKRTTNISWNLKGAMFNEKNGELKFELELKPHEELPLVIKVIPSHNNDTVAIFDYEEARGKLQKKYTEWEQSFPQLIGEHSHFQTMHQQAVKDLQMLLVDIGYGDIPVAGTPWYSVPFGRDSIVTAMFMLSSRPDIARNTLRTLAAYQGESTNNEKDEEPGKIMHELRFGELSTTGQTPFTPYYGTADATPLFLVLATEYYHWTSDESLLFELKPVLDKALTWIREKEASGTNSFVQYDQESEKGIPNQGWKDSDNSMVHKDGRYAESPISLVEIQGYVHAAKKGLAHIYKALGFTKEAIVLEQEASTFHSEFEEHFWIAQEQYYALALDKQNEQLQTVTSNPGHLLLSSVQHEQAIVTRLFKADLNNGYGVRTMSTLEKGYYPMSYHNGSVWPHDNGLCLLGLSKRGYQAESAKLMEQLVDASLQFDGQRLPELYCGYDREEEELVPYPTTCSPQAWSAATALLFTQTLAGIQPDGVEKTISMNPALLHSMERLQIKNIRIGSGVLSAHIEKVAGGLYKIKVLENTTGYEIINT